VSECKDEIETNPNGGRQSRLAERTDLLPPAAVLAVARVLKGGAAKYGDRNWRLIGVREHLNHALTHAYKFLAGDAEEPHLHNAACRLLMALEIELVGMDRPEGFPRVAAEPVPADPKAARVEYIALGHRMKQDAVILCARPRLGEPDKCGCEWCRIWHRRRAIEAAHLGAGIWD
jgi:hypothetical protein